MCVFNPISAGTFHPNVSQILTKVIKQKNVYECSMYESTTIMRTLVGPRDKQQDDVIKRVLVEGYIRSVWRHHGF